MCLYLQRAMESCSLPVIVANDICNEICGRCRSRTNELSDQGNNCVLNSARATCKQEIKTGIKVSMGYYHRCEYSNPVISIWNLSQVLRLLLLPMGFPLGAEGVYCNFLFMEIGILFYKFIESVSMAGLTWVALHCIVLSDESTRTTRKLKQTKWMKLNIKTTKTLMEASR